MFRYRHLTLLLALGILFGGCAEPTRQPQRLRLINNSAFPIKNLIVIFPEERIAFGDITAGGMTEFKSFRAGVFGYAAYSFDIDGVQVTQPVTDWMGEQPLQGSAFTYVIEFDPGQLVPKKIRLVEVIKE